jgi:hypothetical protein
VLRAQLVETLKNLLRSTLVLSAILLCMLLLFYGSGWEPSNYYRRVTCAPASGCHTRKGAGVVERTCPRLPHFRERAYATRACVRWRYTLPLRADG